MENELNANKNPTYIRELNDICAVSQESSAQETL